MASKSHFVLMPFMAHGHLIPMVDIAKILAQHNIIVTIVTTPLNAVRISTNISNAVKSGLSIRVEEIYFPATETGWPEGCESANALPSLRLFRNFFDAASLLQKSLEQLLEELKPIPRCIISDRHLLWTADIASKFRIPWVVFDGTSCFALLCNHNLHMSKVYESVSESEAFLVPGLPDQIEFTGVQLPGSFNPDAGMDLEDIRNRIKQAEGKYIWGDINGFEELESEYVKC